MSTAVPQLLGGRYEIGELLGRGGMAEVHKGRDARLGRTVAVKMLRPDLAREPSFQVRFRREAHSAASLNHPSVVAVYDTGEDQFAGNPVPYIVMEYVAGSTLKDLLLSGNRLVPERALEIVDGVLAALAYSHERGIVHRDIKPANVMLTDAGEVKVMDFGIARALADVGATMTQTSAVMGTAQYLSPEQARGEQVDVRSDLYSTGCLLYELLTGRPPFVGDSPVSVAYQHVREEPVPPSQVDPDVPSDASAVVLKALAKSRDERYQTAEEMRADIAAVRAGRSVSAPLPTPTIESTRQVTGAAAATTFPPVVDGGLREDRREGRGGRALAYTLLLLAVVAVFVIAALAGRSLFDGGGTAVIVPNVTGMTLDEARGTLRAEGLELGEQTTQNSDTVPEGLVSDQSPQPRAELEEGESVSVTVSAGVETTAVPSVVGTSLSEATKLLREAGLTIGSSTAASSRQTRNTVIRVRPKEGTTVPVGKAVSIRYASGSNEVPDVTGESASAAQATLERAGFRVDTSQVETDDAAPGTVVTQSPSGESARLESVVRIGIAVAPPPEPSPTGTPTPTPTESTPPPTETPLPATTLTTPPPPEGAG